MISDKERRRAVAELREASTGAYRHVDSLDVIANSVGVEVAGKFSHEVENETYAALADLIDRPTCAIVESYMGDNFESVEEMPHHVLSCGHIAYGEDDPIFCPVCGAEVADDYR